jgi:hypothetical protein
MKKCMICSFCYHVTVKPGLNGSLITFYVHPRRIRLTTLMNGNNVTHNPKYKTVLHRVGIQTFDDKGPYSLLWAGSRVASGKITVNGIYNRLSYRVISIVYT